MIFQAYDTLATVNGTNDLSEIFIYVNNITNGVAMPLVLLCFFLITTLGTSLLQFRLKGIVRIDQSFLAGSFSTFLLATLMSVREGLLAGQYLWISLTVFIVAVLVNYLSED